MLSKTELIQIGQAGLSRLSPGGKMPAGQNGPHGHRMTAARNNCHWSILFSSLFAIKGDSVWDQAARTCLDFILDNLRKDGGAVCHRIQKGRSSTNGLIGQAWTIEALLAGARNLNEDRYMRAASELVLLHEFDFECGLWKEIHLDGSPYRLNMTLNQQIWFMAMAVQTEGPRYRRHMRCFLDQLPRNAFQYPDGLYGLPVRRGFKSKLRYLAEMKEKRSIAAGYHLFALKGLSMLFTQWPEHPYFKCRGFRRALQFAFSDRFLSELKCATFGFPYNVPGFEIAYIHEAFSSFVRGGGRTVNAMYEHQMTQHYNAQTHLLELNTPDADTLSARIYEVVTPGKTLLHE